MIKKNIIILFSLFIALSTPVFASASIDTNLYYGIKNSSAVIELQEFLIDKGFLNYQVTGNFYSLTLSAVRKYQSSVGITPTGYVGIITRKAINKELLENLDKSIQEQNIETPIEAPKQSQEIQSIEIKKQQPLPPSSIEPISNPAQIIKIEPTVISFFVNDAIVDGTISVKDYTKVKWGATGRGLICNEKNSDNGEFYFSGMNSSETFKVTCFNIVGEKTVKEIVLNK